MLSATRTLTRCLVCGSSEVRTDEVVDRGLVLLAECPRCQHLWTVRQAQPAPTGRTGGRSGRGFGAPAEADLSDAA
jgi:hypothetical protein